MTILQMKCPNEITLRNLRAVRNKLKTETMFYLLLACTPTQLAIARGLPGYVPKRVWNGIPGVDGQCEWFVFEAAV